MFIKASAGVRAKDYTPEITNMKFQKQNATESPI